ncbi:MAG: phenylalanine--tRNA ligase subunit beta [Clostridiales bacterium]|nr:phenylalanine--tRNA ligase subunit beta [Clostridiales bacterium]
MQLSMKWLKNYVDVDAAPRAFSEAMTMSGSKVEGYEIEGSEIDKVVVGKILTITQHPNADKLVICSVDVGQEEPLQIVTGATNLKEGDIVPVAMDGSTLPGGVKIKKGKLRGVESCGMLCSLGELGLTIHDFPYAIEDGIFVLEEECELGQDIQSAIGLNDTIVEFEITSNRPDCLSVIGLAREAAATFEKPLKLHTPEVKAGHGDGTSLLNVNIEAGDLCSRYAARIVKNVRVKPSPRWMREYLRASGVRPINNIVDITNFVMLEYGQPMHAFDLRFIDEGSIRVRRAAEGEQITTLDGVERALSNDMLVIADANKPVAVAGVMGGEYSGIMDDTTTIVFESACFSGPSVRITAKKLGMRTDASARFEKGLDPNNCIPALERACELVELLDAGDVMDGIIDADCSDKTPHTIPLEADWTNQFLGIDIPKERMIEILESIDCKVENDVITVPTYRADLEHKADIAEEIARFYGYDNIPVTQIRGSAQGMLTPKQKYEKRVSNTLLALGYSEIMTYSFISPKYYDKIRLPGQSPLRSSITIQNPLGEDTSIMRTISLPSMCEVLARNYANRNLSASLFEIATEYIPTEPDKLPDERLCVVMGAYGEGVDFYSVKGAVEELLERARITGYDVEADADQYAFHPGRCAKLTLNGRQLGLIGELHPEVLENYEIGTRAYAAVLDFELMFECAQFERQYQPLPKFPATTRDLALLCDEDVPVLKLEKIIAEAAGSRLESVALFDVYQGKQIEAGKKSVAFNLVLRSPDSTLTVQDADAVMKRVMKALSAAGAELRS